MVNYELSLWTHNDDFLALLRGQSEFDGQAYDVQFTKNVNGTLNLTFAIPLYVADSFNKQLIENPLWAEIINEKKIRLIIDKKLATEKVYDFVIKDFEEFRDGEQKTASVSCSGFFIYELSKVGYSADFYDDWLVQNYPNDDYTIDFWMDKILPYTRNEYNAGTNTDGWKYYCQTLFEEENIDSYTYVSGDTWTPVYGTNVEKQRIIKVSKSNVFNIIQEISEKFGVWANFKYIYNDFYKVIGREIYFNTGEFPNADSDSLISVTNLVTNGNFASGTTGWTVGANINDFAVVAGEASFTGRGSIIISSARWVVSPTSASFVVGNKYYIAVKAKHNGTASVLTFGLGFLLFSSVTLSSSYVRYSSVGTADSTTRKPTFGATNESLVYIDDVICIDLTATFGAGNEPTAPQMDAILAANTPNSWFDGTVTLQTNLSESNYIFNYGTNLQSVKRKTDTNDIVTKMYVTPIESEFEDDGYLNIDQAKANFMMSNFLYNFDYYKSIGLMTDAQYLDLEVLKSQVRLKNISIKSEQSNALRLEKQEQDLLAKIDFTTFKKTGADQMVRDYSNQKSFYQAGDYTITDSQYSVKQIGQYTYGVDLSDRKGIKTSPAISIKKLDNSTIALSGYIYDQKNPKVITGIYFISNPGSHVKVTLTYNTHTYFDTIIFGYQSTSAALAESLNVLNSQLSTVQTAISTSESTISTLISERDALISTFESANISIVKEGEWQDSAYSVIRKTYDFGTETVLTTADTSGTYLFYGSIYPSGFLNNMDLENLELWQSANLTGRCYSRYVDYDLVFGTQGANRVLIFKTIVGSQLATDIGSINTASIKVKEIDKNVYSTVNISKGTCTPYASRYFSYSQQNILPHSFKIYSKYTSENDPTNILLVEDTDYSVSTSVNPTTKMLETLVELKTSTNAWLIATYPKITVQTNESVEKYYYDAVDTLNRSAYPNVTYDISVVDISSLEGFEDFTPNVGQKILIIDRELKINGLYGFISEITYDLDRPEQNKVTISNYKEKFEDMMQRIVASSESVKARENSFDIMTEVISPKKQIYQDILQNSLTNNYYTIGTGTNNSVVWDATGITVTDANPDTPVAGQVKILGSGIYLSSTVDNNGVREWTTGIDGKGINASAITTGVLDTKEINIWNSNQVRFTWIAEGLFAYGLNEGTGATDFDTYVRYNDQGLVFKRAGQTNPEVSLTWAGLEIQGQDGSVKLTSDYGLQVFDAQLVPQERVQIGRLSTTDTYGIRLKDSSGLVTLETDDTGKLWLKDVLNVGTGTSTVGLYGGGSGTEIAIWAGNAVGASAPFKVDYSGKLTATEATITGTITANLGYIGGWEIDTNEIFKGTGANKISLNSLTPKITIGAGNYNNLDTSFYVDHAGQFSLMDKLKFDGGLTVNGTINASSGTFLNTVLVGDGANYLEIRGTSDPLTTAIYSSGAEFGISGVWLDASGRFSLGEGFTYSGTSLNITGTITGSTFKTDPLTGNGSTSGVIIDSDSMRFYSSTSAAPVSTISNLTGDAEFNNITARGALKSTVFIYDEVNAQGGSLLICESGVLFEDTLKAENATELIIKVKNTTDNQPNLFDSGDTLRIKTYLSGNMIIDIWLEVGEEAQIQNRGSYTEYPTTIVLISNNSELTLPAGTPVINYGKENTGFVLLKGDDLDKGPYIDVLTNGGVVHTDPQTINVRLGNLSGIRDPLFGGQLTGYGLYSQNAYLTGNVSLPGAGMTNDGAEEDSVRIYAGSGYSGKDNAPFRVLANGDMIAKRGTFEGTFTGYFNLGDIEITDTTPLADGSASIRFNHSAVLATNLAANGDMSSGTSSWIFTGSVTEDTINFNSALKSLKVVNGFVRQNISRESVGDMFYISVFLYKTSGTNASIVIYPYNTTVGPLATLLSTTDFNSLSTGQWVRYSAIATENNGGISIAVGAQSAQTFDLNFDDVLVINLTKCFGAGDEPTKEDMDTWLSNYSPTKYFNGTVLFPTDGGGSVYYPIYIDSTSVKFDTRFAISNQLDERFIVEDSKALLKTNSLRISQTESEIDSAKDIFFPNLLTGNLIEFNKNSHNFDIIDNAFILSANSSPTGSEVYNFKIQKAGSSVSMLIDGSVEIGDSIGYGKLKIKKRSDSGNSGIDFTFE